MTFWLQSCFFSPYFETFSKAAIYSHSWLLWNTAYIGNSLDIKSPFNQWGIKHKPLLWKRSQTSGIRRTAQKNSWTGRERNGAGTGEEKSRKLNFRKPKLLSPNTSRIIFVWLIPQIQKKKKYAFSHSSLLLMGVKRAVLWFPSLVWVKLPIGYLVRFYPI